MMIAIILIFPLYIAYADTSSSFSEPVPFGVIHTDNGNQVSVVQKPSSKSSVGILDNHTVCTIVSSQTDKEGVVWYQIGFIDNNGYEQTGYVNSQYLNQLTVAGLLNAVSDPNVILHLQKFDGFSTADSYIQNNNIIVLLSATTETTSTNKEITYVLNTNTKKFHYPWCSSVNDIKKKNRKDFYDSRNEIPSNYKPCKKCNP